MGKYTVIADVGMAIVKLLRTHLGPEIIQSQDSIGICTPDDPGDMTLGVYLYDIRENDDYRNSSMIDAGISKQKYPSKYLTLCYMITAYSNGDVKYKSIEEQKILGKVAQVLSDYNTLEENIMESTDKKNSFSVLIELNNLSAEEKIKLWTAPNKAYKLSLFYKVAPIELESERIKNVRRVSDISITIKE